MLSRKQDGERRIVLASISPAPRITTVPELSAPKWAAPRSAPPEPIASKPTASKPTTSKSTAPKSSRSSTPLLIAIAVASAIGAGSLLSMLGSESVEDLWNGAWGRRITLTEMQHRQATAISTLENVISAVSTDMDFLSSRIEAAAKRRDVATTERFVRLDADMTALKSQLAAVQAIRSKPVPTSESLTSRIDSVDISVSDARNEVAGLRSSLHDLATAQRGEIASIAKRLEKIETKIAARAETTGSIRRKPASRKAAKRATSPAPKEASNVTAKTPAAAPETPPAERGHIVDVPIVVLPAKDPAAPGY